jgi:hypothetical protein
MVDTAIFLGAGASKAEGAPLQGELFRDYFSSDLFKNSRDEMDRELATFFLEMFRIDVDQNLTGIEFPTFEEVLGLTDLAIMRKEAFRHFDIENRAVKSGSLRFIAQHLVFLVAKILDAKLQDRAPLHRRLVKALGAANELHKSVFVSTNYDILIDNALTDQFNSGGVDLDYGVEFRNFERLDDWRRPKLKNRVQLFKPHGSLNWLFCRTCNELEITPKEKGVVTRLISRIDDASCERCASVYSPLIVPPTFYKDMNNVFLSTIWNRTDIALQKVNHIIFCGYSFPDADIHIKYLLKRAQTNRQTPIKYTVINHFKGKRKDQCKQEKYRYERFLGPEVNYTAMSFEEFVANPLAVLRT